jgi:Holliday junction resolvase-like predicted endonuclease
MERGGADLVTVRGLERVAATLGARVEVRILWQGEGLDRLLDARHAALVERLVVTLVPLGWQALTEVSFNIRSERGSIDVLAHHAHTGGLLVVEVKSVVPDLQAMLVALDRKARLSRTIAEERGWRVTAVGRLLVLPEDRTARRRINAHRSTFEAALPARNVEVRRWLRHPGGPLAGLVFLTDGRQAGARHRITRPRSGRTLPSDDRS